ncbi:hypothetical protein BDY19DRAFT_932746 [Irpex rosettiformis]|uniref:Uncharacterized protein n=1 Tax=Irpex rosettiformis TaxID=378272 RepID=A0ACB8U9X0_9APHY|nr:hypothetical protein BDY19DRAFT_932746 [Irpex rosettiformis]
MSQQRGHQPTTTSRLSIRKSLRKDTRSRAAAGGFRLLWIPGQHARRKAQATKYPNILAIPHLPWFSICSSYAWLLLYRVCSYCTSSSRLTINVELNTPTSHLLPSPSSSHIVSPYFCKTQCELCSSEKPFSYRTPNSPLALASSTAQPTSF